jgi:hypothetical protein
VSGRTAAAPSPKGPCLLLIPRGRHPYCPHASANLSLRGLCPAAPFGWWGYKGGVPLLENPAQTNGKSKAMMSSYLKADKTTVDYGFKSAHISLAGNIDETKKALHLIFAEHCKPDKPKSPF